MGCRGDTIRGVLPCLGAAEAKPPTLASLEETPITSVHRILVIVEAPGAEGPKAGVHPGERGG